VLKRAHFMTAIDGVFCVRRACDTQTWDVFQPLRNLRLTGVRF